MFNPKISVIFLNVISIFLSSLLVVSYFAIPPTISASAYFSSIWHARSMARYVLLGSNPFSKRELASLLRIFLEVHLTLIASNIADSMIIFFVVSSISVSSPPITPASPMALVPSDMTISSFDKFLLIPSNVVNSSASFAILTSNIPFKESAS